MNNPIINPSTLTEEQREAIRKFHKDRMENFNSNPKSFDLGATMAFEWLFGKDFFEKGGKQ